MKCSKIPITQVIIIVICVFDTLIQNTAFEKNILSDYLLSFWLYICIVFYGCRYLYDFSNCRKRYVIDLAILVGSILIVEFLILIKDIGFSFSIQYIKDYSFRVLGEANRSYEGIFRVLFCFSIFSPFMSKMFEVLNNREKRAMITCIFIYFLFMTSEMFLNYGINIANFPFLNLWGYVICGYLITNVTFCFSEFYVSVLLIILSIGAILLYQYHPFAAYTDKSMWIFTLSFSTFFAKIAGKRYSSEISILPVVIVTPFLVEVLLG